MLKDQNNPQVLAAITDIMKGNRAADSAKDQKITENLASRYSAFKPVVPEQKAQDLQESLTPSQKKIAKVAGNRKKIDAADFKALRSGAKVEEAKDTPGNSYEHQCAIHVKHSTMGEGKTLFSQHAEPDENGEIAWYTVMFEHGLEKVDTSDLEVLVSESHGNHKKKA